MNTKLPYMQISGDSFILYVPADMVVRIERVEDEKQVSPWHENQEQGSDEEEFLPVEEDYYPWEGYSY